MQTPSLPGNPTLPDSVLAPDNYSYRQREWTAPKVTEDETILFDEPGRVFGRARPLDPESTGEVDCKSHYFRVTAHRFGRYSLHVKHGGGQEVFPLGYNKRTIDALTQVDSDGRYLLLHAFMDAYRNGANRTAAKLNADWQKAAAEKRIKTRKLPGRNEVKVWIEPAPPTLAPAK